MNLALARSKRPKLALFLYSFFLDLGGATNGRLDLRRVVPLEAARSTTETRLSMVRLRLVTG